ncbi:unnamed protein product [Closterium sp. Naga37s-1]|nr:unnamed protein product [Closterium sp. Naga37s-1]CAI5488059.1 unnamed protein product [Closterium sp. Naga37s-1]
MLELLSQLDGFSSDGRIKVVAATNRADILDPALMRSGPTNRADILDPALMRSGRLDRKIEFPHPTEEARARILQIHSRKMNVHPDVNFEELARSTDDFNGAQLKAVYVEAGMLALRRDATEVAAATNRADILDPALLRSGRIRPAGPSSLSLLHHFVLLLPLIPPPDSPMSPSDGSSHQPGQHPGPRSHALGLSQPFLPLYPTPFTRLHHPTFTPPTEPTSWTRLSCARGGSCLDATLLPLAPPPPSSPFSRCLHQVVAATNRADILDPALMRSGRLVRKIEFPHPTEEARARILQVRRVQQLHACLLVRWVRDWMPPPGMNESTCGAGVANRFLDVSNLLSGSDPLFFPT